MPDSQKGMKPESLGILSLFFGIVGLFVLFGIGPLIAIVSSSRPDAN